MFLQYLINGLTIGSTYALVAIGYSMIFSVLELINFANGSMYMLGGYLTLMVYLTFSGNFFLAFFLSIAATGLMGFATDKLALSPLRRKNAPKMSALISTLGMGTFIDNAIMLLFGSEGKNFPNMLDFGKFYVGNVIITYTQLIILGISVALMGVLCLVVYRTKLGKAMRSTAQNVTAAKLMGIDVDLIISITFVISSAMAAIAGTLVGMYYQSVDLNMGMKIGFKTFAAAVFGGVGVLPGAMVGGLLIGMIESLGASYISSGYRDAYAFIIMILVLLFKPSGIFGKTEITKI